MLCPADSHRRRERPAIELADVFRQCTDSVQRLAPQPARVVRAILRCRTAALGGHIYECNRGCGYREIAYNSCRDRHCPKCQGIHQLRWLEAQQRHLLPIEYHHVVFTIPDALHALFRAAPRLAYGLLFDAVADTLRAVAGNPRLLGAKIGFTSVLHTWTQTLLYHPHIHCIVTGGGLHPDGTRWIPAKPGFLFPVRILAVLFRAKLLRRLERALQAGRLISTEPDPHALLRAAALKNWVVYSKPPFGGPQQVLRYLGRYTHRVAISNRRLVALAAGRVTFRWKDRARGNKNRVMTLAVEEFQRRFLLHLLPQGLMRIRHYGLLANPSRRQLIARSRQRLAAAGRTLPDPEPRAAPESPGRFDPQFLMSCPRCSTGRLVRIEALPPEPVSSASIQPRAP